MTLKSADNSYRAEPDQASHGAKFCILTPSGEVLARTPGNTRRDRDNADRIACALNFYAEEFSSEESAS